MTELEMIENTEENIAINTSHETVAENDNTAIEHVMTIESRQMTTDFILMLHKATGQGLFSGEWAPNKIGLRQFGRYIQTLWEAFEQEDPYAQWQLLKIHEAIQTLKKALRENEIRLHKQIRGLRGMNIKAFRNAKPLNVPLKSVDSFMLAATMLITKMDYLVRLMLTIKQLGLVPIMPVRMQELCEELQKIFVLSESWEKTDITRQEIIDNSKKAQKIEKQKGKLPEDILYQKATLPFLLIEE